jgi:hypothetical protein
MNDIRIKACGDRGGRFAAVFALNDKGQDFLDRQFDFLAEQFDRGLLLVEMSRLGPVCNNAFAAGVSIVLDLQESRP